jgi:hypothetical protein
LKASQRIDKVEGDFREMALSFMSDTVNVATRRGFLIQNYGIMFAAEKNEKVFLRRI